MAEKTQFDQTLSAGLHDALDGQRGRALEAFGAQAGPQAPPRWRPVFWGGLGLAAAAVIAISFWVDGQPRVEAPLIAVKPAFTSGPGELQRYTVWRNDDRGPRVLAGNVPVREYRRQVLEQVRWRDPQTQAEMSYTKPRQDVVFVQMTTY
jgi:hypothetical protein